MVQLQTLSRKTLGAVLVTSALAWPTLAFAQSTPTLATEFSQMLVSQTIAPTAAPTTVTAGDITITIPTGAFGADPVTFSVLQGSESAMTPTGTTAVTDFAFQVTDNTTGASIQQFAEPVTVAVTASAINAASEYWNVSPTGTLALNPVAPSISGETLTHKIATAAVGWVVANPMPATDFTQHGFPTVLASTAFTPGEAVTLGSPQIRIAVPADAFNIPVTIELLRGPAANFASALPKGQSIVTDFALKVIDTETHQLVPAFGAPVLAEITSPEVTPESQYLDVSSSGMITANPIAPTIDGHFLTHPIAGAPVGWIVTSPAEMAKPGPKAPDFAQHGFPWVIAHTAFNPGRAASLSGRGIHIMIPANAFGTRVMVQLLQGPVQRFAHRVPAGQRIVTDFALRVINPATHQLVMAFNAPVIAKVTAQHINQKSQYLDVAASGSIAVNPVAPIIRGQVLMHAIKAAAVGWVITAPGGKR